MAHYIDGFVVPIPRAQLDDYRRLVTAAAAIWKAHGALSYREFVGDDLSLEGTRSFTEASSANDTDAIVFGYVEFESRAARDLANQRVAEDARMLALLSDSTAGFDPARMIYGGFRSLVE